MTRDGWLYGWAVGYAAVGSASLLVPLYALALGGGPPLVGLLAAAAAFAGVPGALLWGWLAGRTGRRRPFLLVALAATAAVLASAPLVRAPWHLLIINAAMWFVVAAAAPVLNLLVVDGVPESQWSGRIARLNTYQETGWLAGIALGAVWTAGATAVVGPERALRLLFLVLAGLAALGCLTVARLYPDPVRLPEPYFRRAYRRLSREEWGAGRVLRTIPYAPSRLYWGLVTLRPERLRQFGAPLVRYLVAVTLFSVGFAVFWGPMPAYLIGIGNADGTVFLLFLAANLGSVLAYSRVAKVIDRVGAGAAQTAALAARVVLFPAVGVIGGLAIGAYAVAALFFLVGATWAVIAVTTTTLVVRLTPRTGRGEGLGVVTALVGAGTGTGSIGGGLVAGVFGYPASFTLAAGTVLLGGILVLVAAPDGRSAPL
ncbi:MFS transporter [Halosegnis sp.]|uniref:MFS transporter n=1 Tax=Halosegnis sp. TaxID=2864959 RepID=UPI0035D3EEB7